MQQQKYRGNGKLLLTCEYFVLDGVSALALPTQRGQTLTVTQNNETTIVWKSDDNTGKCWFQATYSLNTLEIISSDNHNTALALQQMLRTIEQNTHFFSKHKCGFYCETHLEFPRNWGLGSSSTLIYLLAQWTNTNPYYLLENTMGGSGYDIACAATEQPIIYQRNNITPIIQPINFNPSFKEQLFFIHLNKKQNSREGITRFREKKSEKNTFHEVLNQLTNDFLTAENLDTFESAIQKHEELIANFLDLQTVQSLYFTDFWGQTKSLGAWGGDFILATSNRDIEETINYFQHKGFDTVIPYKDMILPHSI